MRSRYKILILLFTVTLALGILVFLRSGNDTDALIRFRTLFANPAFTLNDLKNALISMPDRTSVWYGGISLFAIAMIALAFRAAGRGGLQRHRNRLIELKPIRTLPESALHRGHAGPARDPALQSSEVNARRIYALENQLREKEKLLRSRDEELDTLRSQMAAVHTDGPSEAKSGDKEIESILRGELKRVTALLETKDSTITELENSLSGKQQLLQNRSNELDALKSSANSLTEQIADFRLAKERAENLLQQELKKSKTTQAKDSIIAELENSLTVTQELLQSRSKELDALKSNANSLTEQIADFRLAKERAENLLQRELEKSKALQAKDSIVIEPENGATERVHALESELSEKQESLQARNRELKTARAKLNTMRQRLAALEAAKKQAENALQQQLRKKTELLESKDTLIRELQGNLNTKAQALEGQLKEKERLLQERDLEFAALASKAKSLTEAGAERERAKSLLLQELQSRAELLQAKDAMMKELQEKLNTTVEALERARGEVERLERRRDVESSEQLTKSGSAKKQGDGLLRPDRKGMNSKLLELGAVKARAAASLKAEEAKRASAANHEEVLPRDNDDFLETSEKPDPEPAKKERN